MRIAVTVAAPPHTIFAPGAVDAQRGRTVPVNTPEGSTTGTVTAAHVTENGAAAHLTLDIAATTPPKQLAWIKAADGITFDMARLVVGNVDLINDVSIVERRPGRDDARATPGFRCTDG